MVYKSKYDGHEKLSYFIPPKDSDVDEVTLSLLEDNEVDEYIIDEISFVGM